MKKSIIFIATSLLFSQTYAAEITVSAAASLKDAFTEIAAQYHQAYPQATVKLNTAGSGALLQQVVQGAPVDVVAFADQDTMNQAQEKNVIDVATRKTFANNALQIAAPASSHAKMKRLSDLNQFTRIAISNPDSVPVGRYSKAVLEKSGLWDGIQSKVITTQNVRQTLDYVARGEVDAGFVYATDATLLKDKVKVLQTVPTEKAVSYPIAIVSSSTQKAEAQRFAQYVLSAQGQRVLNKYGFKKP